MRRDIKKDRLPLVIEWIPGHTDDELAVYLSDVIGLPFTRQQAKNWRLRHRIPLGKKAKRYRPAKVYSDELVAEVKDWIPGHTDRELAAFLSERLGREITTKVAKAFRNNRGIPIGRSLEGQGRFQKGQTPWSKGKKLGTRGRSGETQFKKGNVPHNFLPVGSKVKCFDHEKVYYWKEKIAEPDVWVFCHRKAWEEVNGPIPEGYAICFLDGNRDHYEIENLRCISKSELAVMNNFGLWTNDAELTETALNIAKLKHAYSQKKKERKKRK